jgi:hypothetical protein
MDYVGLELDLEMFWCWRSNMLDQLKSIEKSLINKDNDKEDRLVDLWLSFIFL